MLDREEYYARPDWTLSAVADELCALLAASQSHDCVEWIDGWIRIEIEHSGHDLGATTPTALCHVCRLRLIARFTPGGRSSMERRLRRDAFRAAAMICADDEDTYYSYYDAIKEESNCYADLSVQ